MRQILLLNMNMEVANSMNWISKAFQVNHQCWNSALIPMAEETMLIMIRYLLGYQLSRSITIPIDVSILRKPSLEIARIIKS